MARKARSIGDPDLLGNWLYGVALRTARGAKKLRLVLTHRGLPAVLVLGQSLPISHSSCAIPQPKLRFKWLQGDVSWPSSIVLVRCSCCSVCLNPWTFKQ